MISKIKKILLVEDEKPLSEVLREKLEDSGYKVFVAHDGESGLSEALKEKPDLILLDLLLPRLTGNEMLKKLRQDIDYGVTAKVIILSNYTEEKTAQGLTDLAVLEYLIKADCKIEDIIAKVNHYLK
jgi:DNA-binding response OmpR family regulator